MSKKPTAVPLSLNTLLRYPVDSSSAPTAESIARVTHAARKEKFGPRPFTLCNGNAALCIRKDAGMCFLTVHENSAGVVHNAIINCNGHVESLTVDPKKPSQHVTWCANKLNDWLDELDL